MTKYSIRSSQSANPITKYIHKEMSNYFKDKLSVIHDNKEMCSSEFYRYYYHWRKTWKYCSYTFHTFLELFRSLNYTIVNSQLPSFEFINSKNNWMIMPWTGGNIAHSIEVSNYLIHYFFHMDIYPKILLLIYLYL